MASYDVLQQRIKELEEMMPELVRKYPDREELMHEFCGYANLIRAETYGADAARVNVVLGRIITRYGCPSDNDELAAED